MKTLSILGCGWLGLAVAKSFKSNYHLKVSTTTKNKLEHFKELEFEPFLISESKQVNLDNFLKCNYLLIALPPSKFNNYPLFLKNILMHPQIKTIEKIIFISSTSIYDNKEAVFLEEHKIIKPLNPLVYDVEKEVEAYCQVIFRCSGLMGYDRVAGKYFANKEVKDKKNPVNYVHQDDVINAIKFVIDNSILGTYNLCAPCHPTKEDVYRNNAIIHKFTMPLFRTQTKVFKRIIDTKKIETLGFAYKYSNPLNFH